MSMNAIQRLVNTTGPQFQRSTLMTESKTIRRTQLQTLNQTGAMHKHFRVTSDEGLRLKSENVIVGRRKKANMEYINRGKPGKSYSVSTEEIEHGLNKCRSIEKDANKGGKLESKHVEEWLNTLLVEYCFEERFDQSLRLSALKKFQIDRNSLLSKALSNQEIDRLYRSLLVYSVGFNKILKELSKTAQLTKVVWRVFSLLIEYCAEGSFESMVAEIEREKVFQLNSLEQQLQDKDRMLDQMNQVEKVNRAKAYKELKHLKEEHIQLKNQKAIIEEDYRQADQAFNQEVTLRLKFEHKINEVNGVHRELGTKHLLLFQDFQTYKIEYTKLFNENEELYKKQTDLEERLYKSEDARKAAQAKERAAQEVIQNLHKDLQSQIKRIRNEEKGKRNEYLNRKELEISHLQYQIQSQKTMLQLREEALNKRIHEISILVEENQKFHRLSEDQKGKIVELEIKEGSYQNRTIDLKTHLQMMEKKLEDEINNYNQLLGELDSIKRVLEETETSLKASTQVVELLRVNEQMINDNLAEMRSTNRILENELSETRNKTTSLDELASNRESLYGKARIQLKEQTELAQHFEFKYKQLETQHRLQKQSSEQSINTLKHHISDLKVRNDNLEQKNKKLDVAMEKVEVENYELRKNVEKSKSNLRDEKFERKQIDLQFKQSLLMVNDEKNLVQELTIEATQAKEAKERMAALVKSMEFLFNEKETSLERKIANLQIQVTLAQNIVKSKAQWVQPMLFEDIRSHFLQICERFNTLNYLYEDLIKSLGPREEEANKKVKRLRKDYEHTQNEIKLEFDRRLFLKDKQLENSHRDYHRLIGDCEEVKKNHTMKQDYIEIVEEKLTLALFQTKEAGKRLDTLQDRNNELNRKVFEVEVKFDNLKVKAEEDNLKVHTLMQLERVEMHKQIQQLQLLVNEAQKSATDINEVSIEALHQKLGQLKRKQDPKTTEPDQTASNNQPATANPSSHSPFRKQSSTNIKASTKVKTSAFSTNRKLNRTQGFSYSQGRHSTNPDIIEETSNEVPQPKEKQMSRKIRNAVSYYTKPSN